MLSSASTRRGTVHPGGRPPGDCNLNIHVGLAPIISLFTGVLILAMPKLLNYIVAVYLIVIGLIGLFGSGAMRI